MKQDYENVCQNCGETFITYDLEAIYCDECWEKLASAATEDGKEKSET